MCLEERSARGDHVLGFIFKRAFIFNFSSTFLLVQIAWRRRERLQSDESIEETFESVWFL